MKEKPILFNGPMVKAILDDSKTQTRRVLKPQPCVPGAAYAALDDSDPPQWWTWDGDFGEGIAWEKLPSCPYGQPGDRLWVQEMWTVRGKHNDSQPTRDIRANTRHFEFWYHAGCHDKNGSPRFNLSHLSRWRSPKDMPRVISRIDLEILAVRAERIQDISVTDIRAEGISCQANAEKYTLRSRFHSLWDSIYGKKPGRAWSDNPWVWVVDFKRIRP